MSFNKCNDLPNECCGDDPYFARGYTPLDCITEVNKGVKRNYNSIRHLYDEIYKEKCSTRIFYDNDTIKISSGTYTHTDSTTSEYYIVKVKNKDVNGSLVEFKLYPANNALTNNGLTETVFTANKSILPNLSFPACNIINSINKKWYGQAIIDGSVVPSVNNDDTIQYESCGFDINGEFKVYANATDINTLIGDGIQNSMGCDGILIQNFTAASNNIANKNLKASRICIGQTDDLTTYVLIAGNGTGENANGLTSDECTEILRGFNCKIGAEITSDSTATTGSVAYSTFKGEMVMPPTHDNPVDGNVYWYISLKDTYSNKYEYELAQVYMTVGKFIWDCFINGANINDLRVTVGLILNDVSELSNRVDDIISGGIELPYIKKNNGVGTGTTTLEAVSANSIETDTLNATVSGSIASLNTISMKTGNITGKYFEFGENDAVNKLKIFLDNTNKIFKIDGYQGSSPTTFLKIENNQLRIWYPMFFSYSNVDIQNGNLVINSNAGFVCEGNTQVPETPPTDTSIASKKYVDTKAAIKNRRVIGTQQSGSGADAVVITLTVFNEIPYLRLKAPDTSLLNAVVITETNIKQYFVDKLAATTSMYFICGVNTASGRLDCTVTKSANDILLTVTQIPVAVDYKFMGIYDGK